jgi:hypothetical protein
MENARQYGVTSSKDREEEDKFEESNTIIPHQSKDGKH